MLSVYIFLLINVQLGKCGAHSEFDMRLTRGHGSESCAVGRSCISTKTCNWFECFSRSGDLNENV